MPGDSRPGGQPRQAKVHDLDLPLSSDHYVGALDISVNDSLFVRRLQAFASLEAYVKDFIDRQRPALAFRFDGFAFNEFNRQKSAYFINFIHGADVGVVQGRRGACLESIATSRERSFRFERREHAAKEAVTNMLFDGR